MNILGIYAIYDMKGKKYDNPYVAISDLMAKRRFHLMYDEEKSVLNKWPQDFQLYKVGEFNIDTGKMVGDKELLLDAAALVSKKENGGK